jgi:hypothetical protein
MQGQIFLFQYEKMYLFMDIIRWQETVWNPRHIPKTDWSSDKFLHSG